MGDYDNVIIVAPLWWNNMAAPLQTFLFKYGAEMNGKHIGLIVSSGESSIERGHRDRYIGSLFLGRCTWPCNSQTVDISNDRQLTLF